MKNHNITINMQEFTYNELSEEYKTLIDKAKEYTQKSYAPYSKFHVGAAVLLQNGQICTGSNQENAAYPSGLCAERVTMFYANAQYPETPIKAIAIAGYTHHDFSDTPISPCGACRQALLEAEIRFNSNIEVLLYGKDKIYVFPNIKSLLPFSFVKDSLKGK